MLERLNLKYKFLKSRLSYYFDILSCPLPMYINLDLTYQCNLKCKVCFEWGNSGGLRFLSKESLNNYLGIETYKMLINQLSAFKLWKPLLHLFGGEPFLYPDILELFRIIKNAGLKFQIDTNGTVLKEYAQQIVSERLIDNIIFSVDGPEDVHDEARGVRGTFQKMIEGINAINYYKEKFLTDWPQLKINSVISSTSYLYIEKIMKFAEDLNISHISFTHVYYATEEMLASQNKKQEECAITSMPPLEMYTSDFPNIDLTRLFEELEKIRSKKSKITVSFRPPFLDKTEIVKYYTDPDFKPRAYINVCLDSWRRVGISPDGTVLLCPHHINFPIGNIKNESFLDIWNSKKTRHFRNVIKKIKFFPICARACCSYPYLSRHKLI